MHNFIFLDRKNFKLGSVVSHSVAHEQWVSFVHVLLMTSEAKINNFSYRILVFALVLFKNKETNNPRKFMRRSGNLQWIRWSRWRANTQRRANTRCGTCRSDVAAWKWFLRKSKTQNLSQRLANFHCIFNLCVPWLQWHCTLQCASDNTTISSIANFIIILLSQWFTQEKFFSCGQKLAGVISRHGLWMPQGVEGDQP